MCLPVCMSVCPSVCLSIYVSVGLSTCLSVCMPIYLSVWLSVNMSVCLSICWIILIGGWCIIPVRLILLNSRLTLNMTPRSLSQSLKEERALRFRMSRRMACTSDEVNRISFHHSLRYFCLSYLRCSLFLFIWFQSDRRSYSSFPSAHLMSCSVCNPIYQYDVPHSSSSYWHSYSSHVLPIFNALFIPILSCLFLLYLSLQLAIIKFERKYICMTN